jgi:hypothetical protein
MHSEGTSDNAVLFDLAGEADELWQRLSGDRLVWLEHRDGADLVAVSLRSEPEDLAILLRAVEAWIGENGLPTARFELDGRAYTLPARAPALSAFGHR